MAEYIEREKVIRELEWYIERFPDCAECLEARKHIIAYIPASDVVARDLYDRLLAENDDLRKVRPVVRGKWIPDYDYTEYDYDGNTPLPEPRKFQDGWQCSLCGGYMPSETNFCPNCGAEMEES